MSGQYTHRTVFPARTANELSLKLGPLLFRGVLCATAQEGGPKELGQSCQVKETGDEF